MLTSSGREDVWDCRQVVLALEPLPGVGGQRWIGRVRVALCGFPRLGMPSWELWRRAWLARDWLEDPREDGSRHPQKWILSVGRWFAGSYAGHAMLLVVHLAIR